MCCRPVQKMQMMLGIPTDKCTGEEKRVLVCVCVWSPGGLCRDSTELWAVVLESFHGSAVVVFNYFFLFFGDIKYYIVSYTFISDGSLLSISSRIKYAWILVHCLNCFLAQCSNSSAYLIFVVFRPLCSTKYINELIGFFLLFVFVLGEKEWLIRNDQPGRKEETRGTL